MVFDYRLRLDESDTVNESVITQFFRNYNYIAVRELIGDENPHYHVWIKDERKLEAVRNWVTRGFNVKGNKQYSLTDKSPVSGINYISKGQSRGNVPKLFGTMTFTDDEINKGHHAYWDYVDSQKSKDKENFLDYIVKRFLDRFEEAISAKRRIDDDAIERFLVSEFYGMRKLWDTGVVAKYRNYLQYMVCEESHLQTLRINRRV